MSERNGRKLKSTKKNLTICKNHCRKYCFRFVSMFVNLPDALDKIDFAN
jgi:hypothetical protein